MIKRNYKASVTRFYGDGTNETSTVFVKALDEDDANDLINERVFANQDFGLDRIEVNDIERD